MSIEALYWEANFQIPNSDVQTKDVYVFVEEEGVKFYGDINKDIFIRTKRYDIPADVNPYDYLLSLEEFKEYKKL